MNFVYQSLIKSLNGFIYFEIVCDNEFLFDAHLNEAF